LLCPVCRSGNIKVLDSRDSRDGGAIRRRRACVDCGHRFTTYERIEATLPVVVKATGARQAFDRGKILSALQHASRKRPLDDEQLEAIVAAVELWAATRGEKEIRAEELGDRVMQQLRALDQVAYVRLAAYVRHFETVDEFARLLRELEKASHVSPEGQRTLFEIDARGQITVTASEPAEAEPGDRSQGPDSEGP
jgi:transcriptional repressor NrdR